MAAILVHNLKKNTDHNSVIRTHPLK